MSASTTQMQIVMVLDASGSMQQIQNDVIGSVNSFLAEEKAKDSQDGFTLVCFSDFVKTEISKKPIKDVEALTSKTYKIGGSTALFKAIIDTINTFEKEDNLVMVIVTDGQENASPKEYTRQRVFDLVQKCKADKNWTFSYLSADIDTFDQGVGLGFGTVDQETLDVSGLKYKMASCNTTASYSSLGKQISQTTQKCMSVQKKNTEISSQPAYQTIQPQVDNSVPVPPQPTTFMSSVGDLLTSVSGMFS